MFLPYGTDAPVYYWPFTTVAMIAVCGAAFFGILVHPNAAVPFMLAHGAGLHPAQWVTSNFIHADWEHLLGNMFSLWAFGLIVEGKLGWYKTLAVFLGIGILQCATEQVLFGAGPPGYSCGASAVVFGFMAMSLIWAPENDIQCVLIFSIRAVPFDVSVKIMVGLALALQVLLAYQANDFSSSPWLHLMGAALGLALAVGLLRAGWVDCEHWDLFSVWAGRHTLSEEQRALLEVQGPEYQQRVETRARNFRDAALREIRQIIATGQAALALRAHRRMAQEYPDWVLPEEDHWNLIRVVDHAELPDELIPLLAEYLVHHQTHATLVRLKLAQLLTRADRPAQALKVLAKIDATALDAAQVAKLQRLRQQAEQCHAGNPYEVADEDW